MGKDVRMEAAMSYTLDCISWKLFASAAKQRLGTSTAALVTQRTLVLLFKGVA